MPLLGLEVGLKNTKLRGGLYFLVSACFLLGFVVLLFLDVIVCSSFLFLLPSVKTELMVQMDGITGGGDEDESSCVS